jgi:hypothetical protein
VISHASKDNYLRPATKRHLIVKRGHFFDEVIRSTLKTAQMLSILQILSVTKVNNMAGYARMTKVFKFQKYDVTRDAYVTSRRMATRGCIKKISAMLILGTEVEICRNDLRDDGMTEIGFYRRTVNDKNITNRVVRMGVKEGKKVVGNGSEASE